MKPRQRQRLISRLSEAKILALIFLITAVPMVAALWVIIATSQPDLSDLTPTQPSLNGAVLLNWSKLLREDPPVLPNEIEVRALGYMADDGHTIADNTWVEKFILLPDPGNVIHPAHRYGDQMIIVRLTRDARVRFFDRGLVWVTGRMCAYAGKPTGTQPLYSLEDARVEHAGIGDIKRNFR